MKFRLLATAILLAVLGGCGPIIGQAMRSSTGVKDFQAPEGSLGDYAAAKHVVVFAPFAKAEGAYFICRGQDEADLAEGLAKAGLFETVFYMEREPRKVEETLATLRSLSPAELRTRLELPWEPDAILSGTLLARDETVAPTVGIIQDLRVRLDLYRLDSGKSSVVEIAVREIHKDTIPRIVSELKARVGTP